VVRRPLWEIENGEWSKANYLMTGDDDELIVFWGPGVGWMTELEIEAGGEVSL